MRKGIVLAGGSGSRLYPLTRVTNKQLLPVYDKPMIYYPLSTLMLAGIRDVLFISTPRDTPRFAELLGDGTDWGMNFEYMVQPSPDGLAQAFILGRQFIADDPSVLILGDNIFHGTGLVSLLKSANQRSSGCTLFACPVSDPSRFGVVEFDDSQSVVSLEEKPESPKSNHAVTGLYFYDNQVCEIARAVKPSVRGELEITDINQHYLDAGELKVELMGRGFAWLDTGTHESLADASSYIATLQRRQGLQLACPEEIAFSQGWISLEELMRLAKKTQNTSYRAYLEDLAARV